VKFFITAADVIHSFAIPVAGIKLDAAWAPKCCSNGYRKGIIFHGACSELCGVNHGFMPIMGVALVPQFMIYY
jgi:heme/copper-type cytochrome/quinol oxidase subunit 2